MTLETLLKWALDNNIPMDYNLVHGDVFDSKEFKVMSFNRHTKEIILGDLTKEMPKIIDMMKDTGCSRELAIQYLSRCNWNLPLTLVTYRREHK